MTVSPAATWRPTHQLVTDHDASLDAEALVRERFVAPRVAEHRLGVHPRLVVKGGDAHQGGARRPAELRTVRARALRHPATHHGRSPAGGSAARWPRGTPSSPRWTAHSLTTSPPRWPLRRSSAWACRCTIRAGWCWCCLLYTSDAA